MKKQWLFRIGMLAVPAMLSLAPYMATASNMLEAPAKEITIEGKKPARFNHATHIKLGLACGTCHHDGEHKPLNSEKIGKLDDGGKLKCANCHNSTFVKPELQKRKDVFHARCKECHKTGVDGKKGPTGCNSCHVKKKKKAIEGC